MPWLAWLASDNAEIASDCRVDTAASRKYEAGCTARINLPKPASLEPPVPPGRPFTIMV